MEYENRRATAAQVLAALGKAAAYLLLFLLSQLLVSLVITVAVCLFCMLETGSIDPLLLTEQIYAYSAQISLISNLIVLAVLAIFFLIRHKSPLTETGLVKTPPRLTAAGGALALLLYVLVILILSALPESWMESYAEASSYLSDTGALAFLSTALIAPLTEEVIFRGLIQSRLSRVMPGWLAVLLSALLFGLCHGQPVWMGYAFLLGLVFGFIALRARSVLPTVAAHVVFNTIGQLSVILEERQVSDWLFLGALALVGVVACLLARRGVADLFRRPAPQAPSDPF